MGLVLASLYFVLSGVLDSADGQLARISNQSTPMGLILDGICDSIVMIAVYFACALPFVATHGGGFALIVFLALYLHSFQCAILDFYHREYLYFGYGKIEDDTYWNPTTTDAISQLNNSKNKLERIMNSLRLSWVKKQQLLTTRSELERTKMRKYILGCSSTDRDKFKQIYRKNNIGLLPFWRLIGPNAHTFLIIIFMFAGRFDLFIVVFDLFIFNLVILIVGIMQRRADKNLFLELKI
jgi:hypothetical protein